MDLDKTHRENADISLSSTKDASHFYDTRVDASAWFSADKWSSFRHVERFVSKIKKKHLLDTGANQNIEHLRRGETPARKGTEGQARKGEFDISKTARPYFVAASRHEPLSSEGLDGAKKCTEIGANETRLLLRRESKMMSVAPSWGYLGKIRSRALSRTIRLVAEILVRDCSTSHFNAAPTSSASSIQIFPGLWSLSAVRRSPTKWPLGGSQKAGCPVSDSRDRLFYSPTTPHEHLAATDIEQQSGRVYWRQFPCVQFCSTEGANDGGRKI
ncbi:hypothetical protein BIW11_04277 [Tropilaelaps mercedesae]|uniref:Uncharacterized protein n=1 Tax=Tropilaelaps mercedesae TaxID=418985 RepID=A0A1V9X8W8_9ACAR|nr:hypothetical protein BIW11_04277 [Tropilaelaps mercedesae]